MTLTLSVLWLVFDLAVLSYYFSTAEKVEWGSVANALFWTAMPVVLICGLYKEGTKEA